MKLKPVKVNPFLITTAVTISVTLGINLIKLMLGREIDLIVDVLLWALGFWVFYFLAWTFFNKLLKRRMKRKS